MNGDSHFIRPDHDALFDTDEWQPIETAPTDDPEFQALACNYDAYKRCWLYYIINRHDVGGRYECWVIPPGRAVKPTYWMLIPKPPAPAPGTEAYEDLQRRRHGEG